MSTLPSPGRNGANSTLNFYMSSKSLAEKVSIPARTKFIGVEDAYLIGDIQVRRHNGLFWKSFKTKPAVLLKSGRLFIYSSVEAGISVNLFELGLKQEYSEKEIMGQDVISKCEVVLQLGKSCLGVCIKGPRSFVTAWRRGLLIANQGISLRDAKETDEITWSQDLVDPTASEEVLMSMAACSLRANVSMPSLGLFYHSTTLPHMKKYNDVVSFLKGNTMGAKRVSAKGTITSISFYAKNASSEIASNNDVLVVEEKTRLDVDCQTLPEVDSGISSPILESKGGKTFSKTKAEEGGRASNCIEDTEANSRLHAKHSVSKNEPRWHPSRLAGIPMLSSSILCFDEAFSVTSDDDQL